MYYYFYKKYFFLLTIFVFTLKLYAQCDSANEVILGDFSIDTIPSNGDASADDATGAKWFSYTHNISQPGTILISSCGGGTDTRLWVYEGNCQSLEIVVKDDDTCPILEEGSQKVAAVASFEPESGVTYYIEWDNRWSLNGFEWSIDFIPTPPYDMKIKGFAPSQMPLYQSQNLVSLGAIVSNQGTETLESIVVDAKIYNDPDLVNLVADLEDVIIPVMNYRDTVIVNFNWNSSNTDEYFIKYNVSSSQEEQESDLGNNESLIGLNISNSAYAFDHEIESLSVGLPGDFTQGQNFSFSVEDQITAVDVAFFNGAAGETSIVIYDTDTNGMPAQLIYMQAFDGENALSNNTIINTVELDTLLLVEPGTYFVGLKSNTQLSVGLLADETNFFPKNTWFFSENGWKNLEDEEVYISYFIRLRMGEYTAVNEKQETVSNLNIYPNPTNGIFKVEYSFEKISDVVIEIIDSSGKCIMQKKINRTQLGSVYLDLSEQTSGMYVISVTNGKQKTVRRFFLE